MTWARVCLHCASWAAAAAADVKYCLDGGQDTDFLFAAAAGLGPVFVAFFIQRLGRVGAFNVSTAGWIPCGLLLLGTSFTLARDERAMQHRLGRVLSSYSFSSSALAELERQHAEGYRGGKL